MLNPQNLTSIVKQHKRASSTGTTGDESTYTSDEEDNCQVEMDEPDVTIRDHVTRKLFDHRPIPLDSYNKDGYICTISDKVKDMTVDHRNSSDSSMYSDLDLEKCDMEVITPFDLKDDLNSDKSGTSGSDQVDWSGSVVQCSDKLLIGLQDELKLASKQLILKDEELARVNRIRQDVEAELEDLTASLFQEAHNMVREANEKQALAEKALKESQMKVDVLTAEVAALKTLVLTSTPSSPNPHLHPQLSKDGEPGVAIFTKKHRRSPSHFNLKYGRESSPPDSPVKDATLTIAGVLEQEGKEGVEVDPIYHQEFLTWRENPVLDKNNPFIHRHYIEDIDLCMNFSNKELSEKLLLAVEAGTVLIEAVSERTKAMFPKKCALLQVPRLCFYRMNIGDAESWYSISQICRNRIIAVCDFLNYLKYIQRGLVKSSAHDVYWEIVRLRKNICIARLGLELKT